VRIRRSETDLDAEFDLAPEPSRPASFALTLAARGGGRNNDYFAALVTILRTATHVGAKIQEIRVDSREVRRTAPSAALVPLTYPIVMDQITEHEALRRQITSAVVHIGQRDGARGGNPTKRLVLILEVPMALDELATALRYPDAADPLWHQPSELVSTTEGQGTSVLVDRRERSPAARQACIRAHGTACVVCAIDFGTTYGELGQGFIEVHHLAPISMSPWEGRDVDGVRDLRPVCPNCHAMLHRGAVDGIPLSIDELRRLWSLHDLGPGCGPPGSYLA
jgi:hypothetical protein